MSYTAQSVNHSTDDATYDTDDLDGNNDGDIVELDSSGNSLSIGVGTGATDAPAGDGVTGGSLTGSDVVYIIYTVTVD